MATKQQLQDAPADEPVVIRAEPGKPWPEPPYGGSWSRDPVTGDLTLVQPSARIQE